MTHWAEQCESTKLNGNLDTGADRNNQNTYADNGKSNTEDRIDNAKRHPEIDFSRMCFLKLWPKKNSIYCG